MIRRVLAALAIVWFCGFLWFALALPGPLAKGTSETVIVPTGAAGRIERGLELIDSGAAKQMLVTGVDPEVKPGEFAAQFDVPMGVMDCCVILGFDAVDTRGNAAETAEWIKRDRITSIRLVTTDWHMRRALYETRRIIPGSVVIEQDAVASEPSLRILLVEYHKLLASRIYGIWQG